MKLFNHKIIASFVIVALFLFTNVSFISAAQLVSATDVMSSEAPSARSDHAITWTQAASTAYTNGDTIAFAISTTTSAFTAGASGSWLTSDFSLAVPGVNGGSPVAPVAVATSPTCTGHNSATNYVVAVPASSSTTPVFTVTLCSAYGTATTASTVTFKILGATGGGSLTNGSAANSIPITITDGGSNTNSTALAVAIATNDVVTVTATVNPTLSLTITGSTVALGTLTTTTHNSTGPAGAAEQDIRVASNAGGGFLLTYNGTAPTNGSHTMAIDGVGSGHTVGTGQVTNTGGTEGFGINLTGANTNIASSGAPTQNAGTCASPLADYNTANQFSFASATTTSLTNQSTAADCTYHVSYVNDISTVTPAGTYSGSVTYIASATF